MSVVGNPRLITIRIRFPLAASWSTDIHVMIYSRVILKHFDLYQRTVFTANQITEKLD